MTSTCPQCQRAITNPEASFCSNCGARLGAEQSPESVTNLHIDQNVERAATRSSVTGLAVGEIKGEVNVQAGEVILQTSEATDLKLLESISTEIQANTAAGIAGSKIPERLDEANGKLDQLLQLMRNQSRSGQELNSVSAGGTRISRVELLLKKATLLKIRAEQTMLDQVEKHKNRIDISSGHVDLDSVFADFDSDAHDAMLSEAKQLLDEARSIEPANTEVLLHLAEILTQLTADDPADEQRVLYEVQSLLRNPKNDVERFRLAQATFLLATSHEPPHLDSLRDARDMFQSLGRSDWTRHCDDLLNSSSGDQQEVSVAMDDAATQPFSPVGNWNVQVMDSFSSTMNLNLLPDGSFAATQYIPVNGQTLQASGIWAFNPMNSFLQLQGMVGFQPFMLGLAVHGSQQGTYHATGTEGIAYLLNKA